MSPLLTTLEQQARTLAADERARLTEMLLESLHDTPLPETEAAWQREIERRVAAYDRGEAQAYLAAEVFTAARLQGM